MFTAPEEDREIYNRFYPAMGPGLNYAFHGAPRIDVQRARGVAHEILHSLSDGLPAGRYELSITLTGMSGWSQRSRDLIVIE